MQTLQISPMRRDYDRQDAINRWKVLVVMTVAALHLWALNPLHLKKGVVKDKEEVEVLVEVAPSAPAAAAIASVAPVRPVPTARADRSRRAQPATKSEKTQAPVDAESQTGSAPALASVRSDQPAQSQAESAFSTLSASYEVGSGKNPRPPYPPQAYFARIEGKVLLKVQVKTDGKPGEIILIQSSGTASLDKSALETLSRWQFQPAQRAGQVFEQWIEIPIHFRLIQR